MSSKTPILADEASIARTTSWGDYALVDSGGGRKLERYGPYHMVRPEPQCLWTPRLDPVRWDEAEAVFDPTDEDEAGHWRFRDQPRDTWPLKWRDVAFKARFTSFRHLAFFPEQAANWAWLHDRAAASPGMRVLNLFGYTGVASLVCAAAGAAVTHVDASKRSVGWARENAELSRLSDRPIRWLCEDARRYVQREARRGAQYEGIILDPPKYGRGPGGEVWRLFEDLPELMKLCGQILSDHASFVLVNAYAARISGLALAHLLAEQTRGRGGRIEWGELALQEDGGGREIGLSFFARWTDGRQ